MTRVTGIGGVFIRAKDQARLRDWYKTHLGIDSGEWGTMFQWETPKEGEEPGGTAWNLFKSDSPYFPVEQRVMINYRVADLTALLAALRAERCNVDEKSDDTEYGKFGWVTDPEGNRIELWEPPKATTTG
jgi:predicted enzyme related to lactoylglutathione lyase